MTTAEMLRRMRARMRRPRRPARPRHSDPDSALLELARRGPAPLSGSALERSTEAGGAARLAIAIVIPPFRRGSGGHATIVNLARALQARGHAISLWLEDWEERHAGEQPRQINRSFAEFFASDALELHTGFSAWRGADVVLATGWQTVARTLLLGDVHARAYLVQDHEPDFYGASAEALWAEQTYRQGLHCIAASSWLAELLRSRYGASASHFDLGVDHRVYRPSPGPRREDLLVFYARAVTPRRAVPLGLLALSELSRRRPQLEIELYGESTRLPAAFAHQQLGLLDSGRLAELYARATVGVVLSLTNPSLIALEMMACGLPCVELASEPMLATFGEEGPLTLAEPAALALCGAIDALLQDAPRRERNSAAGLELAAKRTWESAAVQAEQGLYAALAGRARGG